MKPSLISASSLIALLCVGAGPLAAAPIGPAEPAATIISTADLIGQRVGATTASARMREPARLAVAALAPLINGPSNGAAAGQAGLGAPATLLGAAAGTSKSDDVISTLIGMTQTDPASRARAIGEARIANLIGSISIGARKNATAGGTVFLAEGSMASFGDGLMAGASPREITQESGTAAAGSSTASITIAAAGTMARPRGFASPDYFASGGSAPARTLARSGAASGQRLTDDARYRYVPNAAATTTGVEPARGTDAVTAGPAASPAVRETDAGGTIPTGSATPDQASQTDVGPSARIQTTRSQSAGTPSAAGIPAGFVRTVSATGAMSRVTAADVRRMSDLAVSGRARPDLPLTPEQASLGLTITYQQLLDFTRNVEISRRETSADGTRTVLSASVSADPSANVVRFLAMISDPPRVTPEPRSIEAFRVVTPNGGPALRTALVSEPLAPRVTASPGPLDNILALP